MSIKYNPLPHEAKGSYETYYSMMDTANIVAVLDVMMKHKYDTEISVALEFNKSLPAIISAFQPKSGGTFLHNRMMKAGYSDLWWGFTHPKDFATVYGLPNTVTAYLKGGCTAHSHFLPHPHTLSLLERAGVPKVWVHLRDPAECIVSAYHHFAGQGQGTGEVGALRGRLALEQGRSLNLPSEMEEFLTKRLSDMLIWPNVWLEFAKLQPDAVFLTSYKELKDTKGLMTRVMRAFGHSGKISGISKKIQADDRFRIKESPDWRDGVPADVVRFIRSSVDERLRPFPFYENIRSDFG